jgi:hypothetical protein
MCLHGPTLIFVSQRTLHRLEHRLLAIRGEDDFQFVGTVGCLDQKSKHAKVSVTANVEVRQPEKWAVGDNAIEFVKISGLLTRESLLFRNRYELAFGYQESTGRAEGAVDLAIGAAPSRSRYQPLTFWSISFRLQPVF